MEQARERGKFSNKSESDRQVRSIRATDSTWIKFGELAEEQDLTRADLLERIIKKQENHLEILEAIEIEEKRTEKELIQEKIKELILGLEKGGKNELGLPSKEKAIARRVLQSLVDYLVTHE